MMSLYGLITIVDRGKSGAVQRIYQTHQVHRSLVLRGHGTANSEIMDMLGLDEPQKELLLTVTTRGNCREILGDLREKLHFDHPGTGIAFTCALSGISVAASELVEKVNKDQQNPMTQKEDMPLEAQPMEMIITVVDSGSTDLVVDAAKAAGAHGGTVIKAREIDGDEQKKIFGMIVQPEKEIVLMLVRLEQKKEIVKAICAAVLEKTGEHALVYSLAVGDTVGLK